MMINVKRVYEDKSSNDGFRILVDRLWPRGVSREKARIDLWIKEIAPSAQLRSWFSHKAEKWLAFRDRYFQELDTHGDSLLQVRALAGKMTVTLLFAAKDERHNNAVALKEYLMRR